MASVFVAARAPAFTVAAVVASTEVAGSKVAADFMAAERRKAT